MKYKYIIFCSIIGLLAVLILVLLSTSAPQHQNSPTEDDFKKTFNTKYQLLSPPMPDSLLFCGEVVPIDREDIREALDRELMVNLYWQSNLLLYFKRAYRFFPIIEPILKKNGIPEDFKYLAVIESGLTNAVSPAKAVGYWQIMKETGLNFGLEISADIDRRRDIVQSTEAACKYLKQSKAQQGSWTAAAAAYNMGDGGYKKTSTQQHTKNYWDLLFKEETARYVFRILAVKILMQAPQQYGIFLRYADLYQPFSTTNIKVDTSINNLTDFALQQGISYKELKRLNPWLISDKLENKSHTTYYIAIPNTDKAQTQHNSNELLKKL
ncbi:MAG: lytic transglycosylase domain-containing protein [Bacteroidales bacterium]|nr:lytic transglycosylase domain-containing protein [Bacteroidales bacterium]